MACCSPAALVERRRPRVGTLALTDHDTRGLSRSARRLQAAGMRFVPGVELSATGAAKLFTWSGCRSTSSTRHCTTHCAGCSASAGAPREIGERLEKRARLPGRELPRLAAGGAAPTRLHLARLLVERGLARDTQTPSTAG
jgi:predicted metal-dependent phosphoesterase TrpH